MAREVAPAARPGPDVAPRASLPMWTGPFGDEQGYRIDEPRRFLRGGLGVVFEAVICSDRHGPDLVGARVGLKQLTGIDDDRWHKLEERSSGLAEVNHPNLSRHLGVFMGPRPRRDGSEPDDDDDPQRYIVHLWVQGRPLADALDADAGTVLRWLRQIGEGVDHLHRHEAGPFAHRDLHPRNVVVNREGDAVVIDFDTVFAGDGWTTTDTAVRSRFTTRSSGSIPPQTADRLAVAKIAMHALAGDGDGVLDDKEVVESAARRLRARGVTPEPPLALLEGALAGREVTSCSTLISQLEAAIGAHRSAANRRIRAALRVLRPARPAYNGGRRPARRPWGLALVIVLVLVGATTLLATRQGPLASGEAPSAGSSTPAPSIQAEIATATSLPMAPPAPADGTGTGPGAGAGPGSPTDPADQPDTPWGVTPTPPGDPGNPPAPSPDPPVTPPGDGFEPWQLRPADGDVSNCSGLQQVGNLSWQICLSRMTAVLLVTATAGPDHQVAARISTYVNSLKGAATSCPKRVLKAGQAIACFDRSSYPRGAVVHGYGQLTHDGVASGYFHSPNANS